MQSNKPDLDERSFASSLTLASVTLVVCAAFFLLIGEATLPRQHPTGLPKFFAIFQDVPVATAMIALSHPLGGERDDQARDPVIVHALRAMAYRSCTKRGGLTNAMIIEALSTGRLAADC